MWAMNRASQSLISILEDGVTDQICLSAQELAASVDLEPGQLVSWLATADLGDHRWHVFFCESELPDEDEEFINTCHDAEGQLLAYSGPFYSYDEARQMASGSLDGWTES
jgi:hypothetical protein